MPQMVEIDITDKVLMGIHVVIFGRIKEFFMQTKQTNWGKNQIMFEIDRIETEVMNEYHKAIMELYAKSL